MMAEFLLQHFDRLAEAPGGIAKLRGLLLLLGVQGKLTQRRPEDTPATEIISYFRKSKQPFASINADELPFQIPATWVWARLGVCMELFNGRAFKPTDWSTQGLPIIRIKNLNNDLAPFNHCATAIDERHLVKDDDFLISWSGTPGTSFGAFIWKRGKAALNQHIFRAELSSPRLHKPYMRLAVNSRLDELIEKAHGGVGLQHVTKPTLERLPLPIPPLEEQRRIVAKVEELMGLCDALEAAQREREIVRTRLRTSTLHRLASLDPDSNSTAFLLQHLPRLTNEPEDLSEFRSAIRQLAVEGKLNSQNSRGALCSANVDEGPYEIPGSWSWKAMQELSEVAGGIQKTPDRMPRNNPIPYLGVGNVYRGRLNLAKVKEFELQEGELVRWRLKPGDLLVIEGNGSIAEIGRCALWSGEIETCVHQNHIIRCRPTKREFGPYILLFLNSPAGMEEMRRLAITSSGLYSLSVGKIRQILIPLPPLGEQRWIVAKVDELMTVLDAFEAALATEGTTAEKLLATTIARITNSQSATEVAEVMDFQSSPEFIRATLAAQVSDQMRDDRHFGQTKLQKVVYLVEHVFRLSEIDSHYVRYARGPHDPELIEQAETGMKNCEWFEAVPRDNGKGKEYHALGQSGRQRAHFEKRWGAQAPAIRRFIDMMKTWSTERCERFATVFAAWNDLLLWGESVSDDAILTEVLQHWHPDKLRIPRSDWEDTLSWMRREGYAPSGWGRATKSRREPELFPQ